MSKSKNCSSRTPPFSERYIIRFFFEKLLIALYPPLGFYKSQNYVQTIVGLPVEVSYSPHINAGDIYHNRMVQEVVAVQKANIMSLKKHLFSDFSLGKYVL
jgi:hypothetical protein